MRSVSQESVFMVIDAPLCIFIGHSLIFRQRHTVSKETISIPISPLFLHALELTSSSLPILYIAQKTLLQTTVAHCAVKDWNLLHLTALFLFFSNPQLFYVSSNHYSKFGMAFFFKHLHKRETMQHLSFCVWLKSLIIMITSCIHYNENVRTSFFLHWSNIPLYIHHLFFFNPFTFQWIPGLIPCHGYYE